MSQKIVQSGAFDGKVKVTEADLLGWVYDTEEAVLERVQSETNLTSKMNNYVGGYYEEDAWVDRGYGPFMTRLEVLLVATAAVQWTVFWTQTSTF